MAVLVSRTTGPLSDQLVAVADAWARSQQRLVVLAAEFADSSEWVIAGAPTAAHWLAAVADVESCTAREWDRIGHKLRQLPVTAAAFADSRLSYSKVRALTRIATAANEHELVDLALRTPAGDLGRALAAWMARNTDPGDLAAHHHQQRSVTWRTEPDGMVTFSLRLPPLVAGRLIALLTTWVMTRRHRATTQREDHASAVAYPTVAQQHADAIEALLTPSSPRGHRETGWIGGRVDTEVVVHVRGDGCTLDDGTPIPHTIVERIAPTAFLRALIHDADGHPINASGRQRHPTTRQKRVVAERDRSCRDCGRTQLLEYDHQPPYQTTHQTVIDELELRCAPCHHQTER